MKQPKLHNFYIPVMGTGFTVDTPLRVAKYGISSVISLVDDILIEKIRKRYCELNNKFYKPITNQDRDPRANRITAYLNLINELVQEQIDELKNQKFSGSSDLNKYFELLPEASPLKKEFNIMKNNKNPITRRIQQKNLKKQIRAGSINANIMTKLDKDNYKNNKKLTPEYSDALSALRGFANSDLYSGIVFSAGFNRRLYSYIEQFDAFFHRPDGYLQKKIIVKVSDYRSAITQGKFLARKGLWVSEFRIESGLNCGGHAFPTNGILLGPVMEEFKNKRKELIDILHKTYNHGLSLKKKDPFNTPHPLEITVQGGISTAEENSFLLDYYKVDATGWATPFLLVPETTNVDNDSIKRLIDAKEENICMSDVSPLNVIFQNLRSSTSEIAKQKRIEKNKPGSPCPKGFLAFNTEFTDKPICTASRKYQKEKIKQLISKDLSPEALEKAINNVIKKSCICHELGGTALIKHKIEKPEKIASAICPGPNMAYFNKTCSLTEMVAHIYGKFDLLGGIVHPNMFITEIKLYIEVLKHMITECIQSYSEKEVQYIQTFYENLQQGIKYYKDLLSAFIQINEQCKEKMAKDLNDYKKLLEKIISENKISIHSSKSLTGSTIQCPS